MSRRRPWPLSRKLSAVLVAVIVSVAANGAALWFSARSDRAARAENCERTVAALDEFTDALATATAADDGTVEAFRSDWHDELADCA